MTINGPAIVLLAFYVALADKRGIPRKRPSAARSRTTA
jgi:methylmalonyl-CoA mutase N-terminal domain/subunit